MWIDLPSEASIVRDHSLSESDNQLFDAEVYPRILRHGGEREG